jgi:hypothetical protein
VLLNTSFNLKDEPIVATPLDAARTFLASGMDALVLGDTLVLRPEGRAPTGRLPPAPVFPRVATTKHLRTFGVGGGAIVGALALLQLSADRDVLALLLGAFALALAVPGAFAPDALRPVEARFAKVGKVIGAFNARVLLSALYLLIVTPLGLLRRTLSGDPLDDARPSVGAGRWKPLDHRPDDPDRYDRMF